MPRFGGVPLEQENQQKTTGPRFGGVAVDPIDQAINESFNRLQPKEKTFEEYRSGGYNFLPQGDKRRAGYDKLLGESIAKTNQFIDQGGIGEQYRDLPFESVTKLKKQIQGGAGGQDISRMIALEHLRLTDPYKADILEEMGGLEGAAIGFQTGLRHVARGVGLGDQENADIEKLASEYGPGTVKVGEVLGEAAPFVPLAMATGGISSLAGRSAAMSGVGAAEGGIITAGQGGDVEDIAVGTLVGGVLGAGSELAVPVVSRAARKFWKSLNGKEPDVPLVTPEGKPTPALKADLDKAGVDLDDLVKEYESPKSLSKTLAETSQASEKDLPARLQDLLEQSKPSPEKLKAAERLGLDDIPAPVLTDNPAFAQAGGTLAAMPASTAGAAIDDFTQRLAQKADDVIQEMGGELDKGAVSTGLRDKINLTRDTLYNAENEIYKEIGSLIPNPRVNTKPMLKELSKEVERMGGVDQLDPVTKKVYALLKAKPTYARLDRERRTIGAALGKKEGVYKDAETATLSRLYAQLSELQGGVASQYGDAGKLWAQSKAITQQRKALEDNATLLFGREQAGAIIPTLESGLKKLPQGDYKKFNQTMAAIPQEDRAKVLATALNGVFTGNRSVNKALTATEYTKWFGSLKRSPQAYRALKDNLPDGGMQRLEDMNALAQGLADVSRNRIKTGIVKAFFDDFDKADGWAAKLYNAADNSPVGVSQTVRVASNIAKMAAKEKTPTIQAADNLLSSPAFKKAFVDYAKNPNDTGKYAKVLERSETYKKYLKTQSKSNQSAISQAGIIPWLLIPGEDEKENQSRDIDSEIRDLEQRLGL